MMEKPKQAQMNKRLQSLQSRILFLISRNKFVKQKILSIGELLDFSVFLEQEFGEVDIKKNREDIWRDIASINTSFHSAEFGVAWGYLTWWFFVNVQQQIISWHGFDRFTGLPRSWRNLEMGTFDAKGLTPDINDVRITWHKGDIEQTIINLPLHREDGTPYIFFFDLDLFEPSLFAWNFIKPHLISGDVFYFDEAFDADERKLISNFVLPSINYKFISASWTSLAIKVI